MKLLNNRTLWLTFCHESESLLVSENVLDAIGRPRLLRLLVNPDRHMLLLVGCEADDAEAIVVPQPSLGQFEIPARALLKRLQRMMGWTDTAPRAALGKYIPDYRAAAFCLEDTRLVQLRTVPVWR